jgi:hypothetical protein
MDIPVAANVLGTLGAVCWSVQVAILLHTNILMYVAHAYTSLFLKSSSITAVTMPLGSSPP